MRVDTYQSNITPEEIALYRSGSYVDYLPTQRINELLKRPESYGTLELLRVKHWRFTQPLMNVILLLLAIPCVLTREPGRLKAAATKCLILTGIAMGSIFLSQQFAGKPPGLFPPDRWAALMAWMPIFIFGPLSVFLLDRVKT
jgi:lipopolysaccharide export LptBFGC system permease protein LptF